ncbi:MAG TPA: hypothetical protein V6D07_18760 [Trichocoleus sp.]
MPYKPDGNVFEQIVGLLEGLAAGVGGGPSKASSGVVTSVLVGDSTANNGGAALCAASSTRMALSFLNVGASEVLVTTEATASQTNAVYILQPSQTVEIPDALLGLPWKAIRKTGQPADYVNILQGA